MKKFLLSTVAIAMLSTAASAADLDMAPAPEPMPMYDWTGFYVGLSGGWYGAKTKNQLGILDIEDNDFYSIGDGWRQTRKPDGGMFGVYGGYNWQMDSGLVLGIEGDFYGVSAKKRSRRLVDRFDPANVNLDMYGKEKIKNTWAIRGRLGWAIENFMPYIAGGFAGASMKTTAGLEAYSSVSDDIYYSDRRASSTKSYTGWTMGAGMEWMITPSWLVRADYQYKDLGKKRNLRRDGTFIGFADEIELEWGHRTKLKSNQFTVGAAFKF
jgi:outer membrane immunogenic protein